MLTLTRSAGTGGVIKQAPEDFVVKEINSSGAVLQPDTKYDAKSLGAEEVPGGKHISFVLQKRDWNTIDALLAIAKKMGHGRKSVAYAGSKDKKAVTVQLASVFHATDFDISSIRISGIKINGQWRSNGVELGSDLGNAFEVTVKNATHAERAEAIVGELDGRMPNYFGAQRFGDRGNNAQVGISILKGKFEEAALEYLTGTGSERNEQVGEARSRLRETMDFGKAIESFPKYLRGERKVLYYLSRYPDNYANALRALPRGIALMFIHAVQSQIFNEELEQRIRNKDFHSKTFAQSDFYGFPDMGRIGKEGAFPVVPLVGYETNEEEISDYMKQIMGRLGISKEEFQLKGIRELAMEGAYRPLLAPVKDLSCKIDYGSFRLAFSLPKGTYATVLLDEFIKQR